MPDDASASGAFGRWARGYGVIRHAAEREHQVSAEDRAEQDALDGRRNPQGVVVPAPSTGGHDA